MSDQMAAPAASQAHVDLALVHPPIAKLALPLALGSQDLELDFAPTGLTVGDQIAISAHTPLSETVKVLAIDGCSLVVERADAAHAFDHDAGAPVSVVFHLGRGCFWHADAAKVEQWLRDHLPHFHANVEKAHAIMAAHDAALAGGADPETVAAVAHATQLEEK